MTTEEITNQLKDIKCHCLEMYEAEIKNGDSSSSIWGKDVEALDLAIKALEQQPCEDCISREAVNVLIDELARAISDERCFISRGRSTATIMQDILDLPPVTPSYNLEPYSDKLWKNAYERGKADAEQTRQKVRNRNDRTGNR